ncbi:MULTISPECIES: protoheme IX farnesyltransferase [Bacillus]|uniref:protoheme IX farnesyltransferase n=1 Tax=Bacillus TaxID=1386 RepID=UPI0018CD3C0A|nr:MULTISPECIES: protoheme IX farnesyltransferase [Bacillus]MBG9715333.1 protoheme IX farnesyltransferase [Bacillus cereus]MCI4249320.1 protoheme IX farnesyltransferase [Bacillus sp. CCB-MMP212]HDR7704537.1 protoheme IX farnesyltransferase [Bacillus thuringiensis]
MEDMFFMVLCFFIACGIVIFGIIIDKETFKKQRVNSLLFSLLTPFPIVLSFSFYLFKIFSIGVGAAILYSIFYDVYSYFRL